MLNLLTGARADEELALKASRIVWSRNSERRWASRPQGAGCRRS